MKIILKSIKVYKGLSKINFVKRIILLFTQSIKRVILKGFYIMCTYKYSKKLT